MLGSASFLAGQGIDPGELPAGPTGSARDGATVVFVGVDGAVAGILAIADPVKDTTPAALGRCARTASRSSC